MSKKWNQLPNGYLTSTPFLQFVLMTMLFPLWSVANALNDVLITQFKSIFELSNFASAFVQSAFFGGYFVMAIPAALVMKKQSYVSTLSVVCCSSRHRIWQPIRCSS